MGAEAEPFGDWLKGEVERRGWTVSQAARRMGLPHQTLYRYIHGERVPDTRFCYAIAAGLGLSPETVLRRAGHLRAGRSLTPEELAHELRESRAALAAYQERLRVVEKGVTTGPEPQVPYMGRMPADTVRWVQAESGGRRVPVLAQWIGSRSPDDFLVVESSGSCLLVSHGILDGDYVLLERLFDREPRNGEVILVRLHDDYALKIWHRSGDWISLRDGEGREVHRVSVVDDVEPIGVLVTRWSPASSS